MTMPCAFGYGRISESDDVQINSPESQCDIIKEFYDRRLSALYTWGDVFFDIDDCYLVERKPRPTLNRGPAWIHPYARRAA